MPVDHLKPVTQVQDDVLVAGLVALANEVQATQRDLMKLI